MYFRKPTPQEELAFFQHRDPAIRELLAAFDGDKLIAMAGIIRDPRYHGSIFEEDGRWIAFLELADGVETIGFQCVVALRHYLKTQTEPIIAQCYDRLPKAERLLAALGFKPTDEFMAVFREPSLKLRIWTYGNAGRDCRPDRDRPSGDGDDAARESATGGAEFPG